MWLVTVLLGVHVSRSRPILGPPFLALFGPYSRGGRSLRPWLGKCVILAVCLSRFLFVTASRSFFILSSSPSLSLFRRRCIFRLFLSRFVTPTCMHSPVVSLVAIFPPFFSSSFLVCSSSHFLSISAFPSFITVCSSSSLRRTRGFRLSYVDKFDNGEER